MKKIVSALSRVSVGWYVGKLIKEIRGLENFPRDRNFIFAQNHLSHLDWLIDGYLCTPRRFTFIGQVDKMTGMKAFWRDTLYAYAEVVRVNRKDKESKKRAITEAIKMLKKGYNLIIYPEGTRSLDGKLHEFKPGVAKFHLESGVAVLPVAIRGTYELMPPGAKLKIKKIVRINIGKPLDFVKERETAAKLDKSSPEYHRLCDGVAKEIEEAVRVLLRELESKNQGS
jgi:1-acyl-sn-glycerol-3-phosphate acyltransferase